MVRVRKNVMTAGGVWNETVLWYARGVKKLKARPWQDATSWRFLAGIHGFSPQRWVGAFKEGEILPALADRRKFWLQCQHQTWYFLPWHRAYLGVFEVAIRDALSNEPGFPGDWALPYWDYGPGADPTGERLMPEAFADQTWPDGGTNPLFEPFRYGLYTDGKIRVTSEDASFETALGEVEFSGTVSTASSGFGGPVSLFTHYGSQHTPPTPNGLLEDQPHNTIHGVVGGSKGDVAGAMSDPTTAALDPIFWLHHANIDRLWEVWLRQSGSSGNPASSEWLDGPVDRKFELPLARGRSKVFTARDVIDSQAAFDYKYDSVEVPVAGVTRREFRGQALGVVLGQRGEAALVVSTELMGSNDAQLVLGTAPATTGVKLDRPVKDKVSQSFGGAAAATAEPDRLFLNLDGIRGSNDGAVFDVYITLPGAAVAQHEQFVGVLAMFGVSQASQSDGPHSGNGLKKVLEITKVVDTQAAQLSTAENFEVRFVPRGSDSTRSNVTIDRVSIYRQGSGR